MRLKHLALGVAVAGVAGGFLAPTDALAQGGTFVPIFSYRTGPFANSGIKNLARSGLADSSLGRAIF